VDTPPEAVRVRLDHHYTERVCVHLLHNAVKFSEDTPVTIGVRQNGTAAEVWVRDSGIGIASQVLPQVHEEFFQASRGLNRSHEGNGLGLTIVSRLVEHMDGTVNINSTPGEGTCVTVRFPAA
jgi:signal transduction histidine kinase